MTNLYDLLVCPQQALQAASFLIRTHSSGPARLSIHLPLNSSELGRLYCNELQVIFGCACFVLVVHSEVGALLQVFDSYRYRIAYASLCSAHWIKRDWPLNVIKVLGVFLNLKMFTIPKRILFILTIYKGELHFHTTRNNLLFQEHSYWSSLVLSFKINSPLWEFNPKDVGFTNHDKIITMFA